MAMEAALAAPTRLDVLAEKATDRGCIDSLERVLSGALIEVERLRRID
jgi:hypothetical protein